MKTKLFTATLLMVTTVFGWAANYSIDWSTIDGGGGTSTGGVYSVGGTIGQFDAGGPMTGGNFSLTGGFWALDAVQIPTAPPFKLAIQLSTTNTVIVSWPSPSTGWTLQENTNPLSSPTWTDHPNPQDNGSIRFVIVNPTSGDRFFRLSRSAY